MTSGSSQIRTSTSLPTSTEPAAPKPAGKEKEAASKNIAGVNQPANSPLGFQAVPAEPAYLTPFSATVFQFPAPVTAEALTLPALQTGNSAPQQETIPQPSGWVAKSNPLPGGTGDRAAISLIPASDSAPRPDIPLAFALQLNLKSAGTPLNHEKPAGIGAAENPSGSTSAAAMDPVPAPLLRNAPRLDAPLAFASQQNMKSAEASMNHEKSAGVGSAECPSESTSAPVRIDPGPAALPLRPGDTQNFTATTVASSLEPTPDFVSEQPTLARSAFSLDGSNSAAKPDSLLRSDRASSALPDFQASNQYTSPKEAQTGSTGSPKDPETQNQAPSQTSYRLRTEPMRDPQVSRADERRNPNGVMPDSVARDRVEPAASLLQAGSSSAARFLSSGDWASSIAQASTSRSSPAIRPLSGDSIEPEREASENPPEPQVAAGEQTPAPQDPKGDAVTKTEKETTSQAGTEPKAQSVTSGVSKNDRENSGDNTSPSSGSYPQADTSRLAGAAPQFGFEAISAREAARERPTDAVSANEAITESPAATSPRPAIARDLSLQVEGIPGVAVQLSERAGKINVAVRTGDTELSKSLQSGLGELVTQLENHGFKTDAWTPAATRGMAFVHYSADSAANPQQSGHPSGENSRHDRQGDSNPRRQTRAPAAFEETLAEEDARTES